MRSNNLSAKIVFVEPYVSMGGHKYRNLCILPQEAAKRHIDFLFFCEKGIAAAQKNKWLCPALIPWPVLKGSGWDAYLAKRKAEFLKILFCEERADFIFLTTSEKDFRVWIEIFKDHTFRKALQERDLKILIQSAGELDSELHRLSEEAKEALESVRGFVFFGFYSELQALAARQLAPSLAAVMLPLPAFQKEGADFHTDSQKSYLSYFGYYDAAKGPAAILEAVRSFRKQPFWIHFNPLSEKNFLFYLELLQESSRASVRLDTELLSPNAYRQLLQQSKAGLLPYDSHAYAIRASGVLEEYLLAGIPVVVPQQSSLSLFLEKYQGGGLCFNGSQEKSFSRALKQLLDSWPALKKQAATGAGILKKEWGFDAFLFRITNLRVAAEEKRQLAANEKIPFAKGMAHYFVTAAMHSLKHGKPKNALEDLENALHWDKNYCVARQMQQNMIVPTGARLFSLADAAKLPAPLLKKFLCKIDASKMQPSFKKQNTARLYWGCFLWLCGKKRSAERQFRLFLKKGLKESGRFTELLAAFEIWLQIVPWELWSLPLQQAFRRTLIQVSGQSKKGVYENYGLASLWKKCGDFGRAARLFRKVIQETSEAPFHSGALFHLGEIQYLSGKKREARCSLQACLDANPLHQKAKEYLQAS